MREHSSHDRIDDSLRDLWKKTQKKPDRIVNIGKEKYEINSLHSCYEFICNISFNGQTCDLQIHHCVLNDRPIACS
jgi:lysozyme family protein